MARLSKWAQNDMDEILQEIISTHPGQTINVYAMARIIEDEYPAVFSALAFPIGGANSRVGYSLPEYLARVGRERVDSGRIEGLVWLRLIDIKTGDEAARYSDGSPLRSSVDGPSGFRSSFQ